MSSVLSLYKDPKETRNEGCPGERRCKENKNIQKMKPIQQLRNRKNHRKEHEKGSIYLDYQKPTLMSMLIESNYMSSR